MVALACLTAQANAAVIMGLRANDPCPDRMWVVAAYGRCGNALRPVGRRIDREDGSARAFPTMSTRVMPSDELAGRGCGPRGLFNLRFPGYTARLFRPQIHATTIEIR